MEKFIDLLSRFLVPLAEKLQANRYLNAISNGFSRMLPIVMVGAIFTLLANLQIAPYQDFVTMTHLKEIFAFAPPAPRGGSVHGRLPQRICPAALRAAHPPPRARSRRPFPATERM